MKNKSFKAVLLLLIIIYIASYYVSFSGYYEYKLQERTVITNEKIKEFEEDIKNNQNIDIKDYLDNKDIDYSNKITNIIYGFSNNGNKIARKCFKAFFKKLIYLLED